MFTPKYRVFTFSSNQLSNVKHELFIPENEIVANLLLSKGGAHLLHNACTHGKVNP